MKHFILFISATVFILTGNAAPAQITVVREGAEKLLTATAKWLGKSSTKEAGKELAEYGGEAFVRTLSQRLLKEGGEEALEKVAGLTARYGPDVLRAVDNAASPTMLLRALDELPEQQIGAAIKRLSAGQSGKILADQVQRHGAGPLLAEIAHPGVGVRLVEHLGYDGIRLAQRVGSDEVIVVARHVDDIAKLPTGERAGILRLLYDDQKRMVEFMGRFIERNPGKSLFTTAATTIVLTNPERVLGGGEIVFDAEGNPRVVSKPGLLDKVLAPIVTPLGTSIANIILPVLAFGAFVWIAIKLWFVYRIHRLKLAVAEQAPVQDPKDPPDA